MLRVHSDNQNRPNKNGRKHTINASADTEEHRRQNKDGGNRRSLVGNRKTTTSKSIALSVGMQTELSTPP
jgi:hypothetical protein